MAFGLQVPAVLGLRLAHALTGTDGLLPVGAPHRAGPARALDPGDPQPRDVLVGQPHRVVARQVEHEAGVLEAVGRGRVGPGAPGGQVVRHPAVEVEPGAVEVLLHLAHARGWRRQIAMPLGREPSVQQTGARERQ